MSATVQPLAARLAAHRVVPVVTVPDPALAPALGDALAAGGLPVAEVTFRADGAERAIALLRERRPELLIGAGTVLDAATADRAHAAGADFVVAPGFNPAVVDHCLERGIAVVPGVNDPSGVEAGLARGLTLLKLFPAEVSGGVALLRALAGPYPAMRFMPTGGVTPGNLADYLALGAVAACGGTWIAPSDDIAAGRFERIAERARAAVAAAAGRGTPTDQEHR